jgi:tRNA pseudouridine38-40 synthase
MRYFLEVSYKGTRYSGFQTQQNANTIQAEVEKAFYTLLKQSVQLTGSSRTDAGVHAIQNFFHFDLPEQLSLQTTKNNQPKILYNLNALLPSDIVARRLIPVSAEAHCRFDAVSREYKYYIYREKNPFLQDRAFYFPYTLDLEKLQYAAEIIKNQTDFTSFSKRKTQVKSFECKLMESRWIRENECLIFHVKANRFLRGMVRALTATMLLVGRHKLTIEEFKNILLAKDCTLASFAVPARGLFLCAVEYPDYYF